MMRACRTIGYDLSIDPALGRLRRAVVSWLGLLLLAFNVLGAGAVPAQADASVFRDGVGGRVVVCTATGMMTVDADGTTTLVDGVSCVFCLPLMHGAVSAPALAAITVIPLRLAAADYVPAPVAPLPSARWPGAASPRAPPLA